MAAGYTPAQLQAWRDALVQARLRGVRSVTDENGEAVQYSSDSEMAAAIAAAERELGARPPVHTLKFRTSKGLF